MAVLLRFFSGRHLRETRAPASSSFLQRLDERQEPAQHQQQRQHQDDVLGRGHFFRRGKQEEKRSPASRNWIPQGAVLPKGATRSIFYIPKYFSPPFPSCFTWASPATRTLRPHSEPSSKTKSSNSSIIQTLLGPPWASTLLSSTAPPHSPHN